MAALMIAAYSGSVADYLTVVQSVDGWVEYSYDSTGQLVVADYSGEGTLPDDESYAWDLNGNQSGEGYIVGADNRLLSDGTYWYEYDAEGNRTARFIDVDESGTLTTGDTEVTEYTWDARNRLVKVTDYATEGGLPTQVVDYIYDVADRWIGKKLDSDGDGEIDHQTRFVYNDGQVVFQFEGDGDAELGASDLSHRYLWRPDVVDQLLADEKVTDLEDAGDVLWTLTDHLGTVRDLAAYNAQTGVTSVVNHRTYDTFGNLVSETNTAVDCLFGYTGRSFDASTALQDNWHRKYSADTRGWLSKDPLAFLASDTNTSRYVGNNPTNAIDPTGFWEQVAGQSHLWIAQEGDEDFYSLVTKVNPNLAPAKNAMCIQPVLPTKGATTWEELQPALHLLGEMRVQWGDVNQQGNVPKPAVGGIYDVSSLLAKRDPEAKPVVLSVGADGNGYIEGATKFFNAKHCLRGADLATELMRISAKGQKPIDTLILIGHGRDGANAIGGRQDNSGPGSRAKFKLGDLTLVAKKDIDLKIIIYDNQNQLAYWPTFIDAAVGSLPPVAWLKTDAVVYVVGCRTSAFADTIADKWLRSTEAIAWGTLRDTWAAGDKMGWATDNGKLLDKRYPLSSTASDYFKPWREIIVTSEKTIRVRVPHQGGLRWKDAIVPKTTRPAKVWEDFHGTKSSE